MRIELTSVPVTDQDRALQFYTEVLGFEKKRDIPLGEVRWLTVVSPERPDGVELVLEPAGNPATQAYQQALVGQGIPYTAFGVDDITQEYERLLAAGVEFTMPPTPMPGVTIAIFSDTCGNLIQIYQV